MIMAENNPLDSGTAASPEPGSQEELDNAVREVGYDGSGDGRLRDLLREAGYDPSVWEPEPEYEAERYNDYIADQEIPGPTPRAGGPLWIGEEIVRLIDEANKIPAQLADIVETHNLRNADWLELPGIEGGAWLPVAPYPDEYGKKEESMLEAVNTIADRSVDAVDAARLVDYASATNILREIDKSQGTNYLHSVEGYRQAAIARNRSVEAESDISADSAVQETAQPTAEIGNDPTSGLPPADDPFVAREFRLDQLDLSADDREAEPEAAVSEPSVDLDKEPAREVPVDSGVRVDPITAGTTSPGAQSIPQPDQRVHDIASWLHNAHLRARAGEAVKPPKPIK